MAVVLPPESESAWLHEDTDTVESLLTPYPGNKLEAYPVSTRVNSPENDESSLIDPINDV
jgi:putative SOS response-associated peptidase YedK